MKLLAVQREKPSGRGFKSRTALSIKIPLKMKDIEMLKHTLVPQHELLKPEDAQNLLKKYNISLSQLPKLSQKDPAIHDLNAKPGDVIKIIRQSPTAGKSIFFRLVTEDG